MDRPARSKKTVDYSQFMELDNDDEDFTSSAPVSKKARVEPKKEKREKSVKKIQEESSTPKYSQGKRLPLDEKIYQRELEVALALSVQETSAVIENDESTPRNASAYLLSESPSGGNKDPEVSFSNCSIDSGALGLDEITESHEESFNGRSRRQAASKAITEQRKLLTDDSDGEEEADEFKPDAAYIDSDSDDSLSDEDEEFEVEKPKKSAASKVSKSKNEKKAKAKPKSKAKYGDSDSERSLSGNDEEFKVKKCKKATANQNLKSKGAKKERNGPLAKSAATTYATPVSIKIKPMPPRPAATTPSLTISPVHSSPPVGMRRPAWTPPASSSSRSPLAGVNVKSPSQGLRLGLSRLARVKPLHPAAVPH